MNEYDNEYDNDIDDMDDMEIGVRIKNIKEELEKNKKHMSFCSTNIRLLEEESKSDDYNHKISLVNELKKNLSNNADFLINAGFMTTNEIIDEGLKHEKTIETFKDMLNLRKEIRDIQESIKRIEAI